MAEKWVDPLEQLLKYHRNISEYVIDFEKAMDFSRDPKSWNTPEFDDFLKKYFYDQFAFEEEKIFPVLVKKVGGAGLRETVQELYKEHEDMLAKVSKVRTAVKRGAVDRDVYMTAREVFRQLLEHAAKEDDEIIPVLKKNRDLFEGKL